MVSLTLSIQAQRVKGRVISSETCEWTDSGYKIIKAYYPGMTFVNITDDKFLLTGSIVWGYHLFDKHVDTSSGTITIDFIAKSRKNYYILALRECQGDIIAAVFPMNGSNRFKQYRIKVRR